MLDRTAETEMPAAEAKSRGDEPVRVERRTALDILRGFWQFFVTQGFSSLTRRIVFLNVTGLLALVIGILYLSQFRAGLIDARVRSLLVQGEIIAGAIAASATVETDSITIDPDRCWNCRPAKASAPRTSNSPRSSFRSIRSAWRRCCGV